MEASNTTTTTTPRYENPFKVGDRVWTTAPTIEAATGWDERAAPCQVTITDIEYEDTPTPLIHATYEGKDGTLSRDTNAMVIASSVHFFRDQLSAEGNYLDSLREQLHILQREIDRHLRIVAELTRNKQGGGK